MKSFAQRQPFLPVTAFAMVMGITGLAVSSANGAIMGKLFGGETERIIERVSLDVEKMLRFLNFKFTVF